MTTSSAPVSTARWMALWLPRLSTDRLRRANAASADRPLALYTKIGSAFTLAAIDARAETSGLHVGMALADARAIAPHADLREADKTADANLLDHIAAWCERYAPVVVPDPPAGLFIDTTGCAHLFGGETALLSDITTRLRAQGLSMRAALAPTPAAAWALARFGGARIVSQAQLREALAGLPVAALRLTPDATALLKRLGLKTIGAIMNAPRAPFAARAGQHAMLRLDQALGRATEAMSPRRPPPPVFVFRRLAEPIISVDAVQIVLDHLAADLYAELDHKGLGARAVRFLLFGVDGAAREIVVRLSQPARTPALMLRLFKERIGRDAEAWDALFGFEAARLDALETASFMLRPTDLAPSSGCDPAAEARLMDVLVTRLGATRVGRLAVRDQHAPERASAFAALNQAPNTFRPPPSDDVPRRPLSLFAHAQPIDVLAETPDGPPIRFRWRRVLHDVARAEGPERIAPSWLRAPQARARDYYRVEDRQGRRFWLYREGLYGEAQAPRWFLHGLFA